MADQRDDIIRFIQNNGPVLPVQIAKLLNTNILFSSAMLSELVDRKILRISHASIGGSPLYFLPGQESLMDERLSKSLSGKEKEAYELIKKEKVVLEKGLEPWQRIAVKSLKDFASPLNVVMENSQETFWKYHLVNESETESIVNNKLNSMQTAQIQETILSKEELKTELPVEEQKTLEIEEVYQEPVHEAKINLTPELIQKEIKKEKKIAKIENKNPSGKFYNLITNYFNENKINVISNELIKKDKEFDFIIDIPSSMGNLRYFVKAKSKPSLNESDISMALGDGKLKNLPTIMLFSGKVNKKINNILETKFKGQLIFKEI